jgi:hypothetical protein
MPENRDKGYQRGGPSGIEGDLGDDSLDMNRDQADLPSEKPTRPPDAMGKTGRDQGQQRGGLRREPNLEGAEQKTGHEVD